MKMSIKNILSVLFVSALALSSCSPDYDTNFTDKELEVPHSSQQAIAFTKEGGNQDITVNTNVALDEWTAESNATWLTVQKKSDGTGVTVTAPAYSGFKTRQAKVTISHGDKSSYSIDVSQMGVESVLTIPEQNPFFSRDASFYALIENTTTTLEVPVETNLNLNHIIVPDTVDFVHIDTTKTVRENGTVKLYFNIDKNTTSKNRFCTLTLQSSDNWDATTECVIEQAAKGIRVRPVYPTTYNKEVTINLIDLPRSYRMPFQRTSADGNYTITIPEEAKSWLSVSKDKITGGEFEFTATQNTTDQTRTCDVTCTPTNTTVQPFTVHVVQEPFQDINPDGVTNLNVTPGNGQFTVKWTQPEEVNYNKVRITAVSSMAGVPSVTKEVENDATSATLDDVYKFAGAYTITVTTVGLRGKVTNSPVSAEATANEWVEEVPVTLTADMLYANSVTKGHEVGLAVDNNTSTYFQTNSGGKSSAPRPYIEVTLENGISGIFNFSYNTRTGQSPDRNPNRVKVSASSDGVHYEDLSGSDGYINYRITNGKAVALSNCTTTKTYTHLRFEPMRRVNGTAINNGSGTSYWYISELQLNIVHDEAWKKEQLGIK
jgi:hypothetical protein